MEKDFKIICEAESRYNRRGSFDRGFIVDYDGDLYFVYSFDEGFDIHDEDIFFSDVCRHACFVDFDENSHSYYSTEGFLRPLDLRFLEDYR